MSHFGLPGLPTPPGLAHLPGGKALEGLVNGLPGMHGLHLSGTDPGSASIHPIVSGDVLDPVGRQVQGLINDGLPGKGVDAPSTGGPENRGIGQPASSWGPTSGGAPEAQGAGGPAGQPPWAHVPHEGRSQFEGTGRPTGLPENGSGNPNADWNPGGVQGQESGGTPRWGETLAGGITSGVESLVNGATRGAVSVLGTGTAVQPTGLEEAVTQSGRFAPRGGQAPNGSMAEPLARDTGVRGALSNRVAVGDEVAPVNRQVTTQRPDGAQQLARADPGAESDVAEWRVGGNPDARVMQRDGQQNQIDPRMGWTNHVDHASMLKLSLTVIPPVLREGEMAQTATRTALFRAVVDGQQAFIDSQGRIVGWAVRQDLAATYVAEVIQTEQLMQLPDGRQVIIDAQGRVRGTATGELLRPVKGTLATDARPQSGATDMHMLLQRAEAHLRAVVWSTALPSCIGLILVVAAFLSAAAVGTMPWMVHVLFLAAAIGLAVFCGRTWKRCNRLPDGSVTKLPAITRRIRVLMALSCSAQGAGAVLLGTAAVLF